MKILIMGLPGTGKTSLASKLVPLIKAKWLNGDEIRKEANDWDFSDEGRIRQANSSVRIGILKELTHLTNQQAESDQKKDGWFQWKHILSTDCCACERG